MSLDHAKLSQAALEYANANNAVADLEKKREQLVRQLQELDEQLGNTRASRDDAYAAMGVVEQERAVSERPGLKVEDGTAR